MSDPMELNETAMLKNANTPEVNNLLGILAKIFRDLSLAGKHYRAASALDPYYQPANQKLDCITSIDYRPRNTENDFGEHTETH